MLYKTIHTGSYDFGIQPVSLVDIHSRGVDKSWMRKRAAALGPEINQIQSEPGRSVLHIIAMGATEDYGPNRNADGFTRGTLRERHPTFVKNGHVYKHHKNKDPKKASGEVKSSAFNEEMKRVELLVGVDEDKWANELEKVANGEDVPFSMACVCNPDYPVLTAGGYKRIEDVAVGDRVLTHEGRWQRVKGVNRRKYTGNVHTLHVNGLPVPLELTADHPMWAKVFSGSRELSAVKAKANRYFKNPAAFEKEPAGWAHTEHLEVGDRLFYQPTPRMPGFAAIDDTRLAKVLGYYLAEGSFSFNKDKAHTVYFACNMDDSLPRVLPELLADMYPEITCKISPHHASDVGLSVAVFSTQFAEFLRMYVGRGCRSKQICPEIFNAEPAVKLAFLGAWLEGGGFCDKKGIHWSTASLNLVLQGRDLLASIGIPASIYRIDHGKCATSGKPGSGVEYTLNVSWIEAGILSEWSQKVAANIHFVAETLRGKPASMRKCPDGKYAYRIKKVDVRAVENLQTYNIEVEEDESYLLAGLISHNCKVPYDVCSICNTKAASRAEYCGHMKKMAGQILSDGRQVYVDNPNPTFFDISGVFRPADRIAFHLQKVASQSVLTGTDLAELDGLFPADFSTSPARRSQNTWRKRAMLRKLAAIEKEIDALAPGDSSWASDLKGSFSPELKGVSDGELDSLSEATRDRIDKLMGALGQVQISLPLRDFVRIVMGNETGGISLSDIEKHLPGVFSRILDEGDDDAICDGTYDPMGGLADLPSGVKGLIDKMVPGMSLAEGPVQKRTITVIARKIPKPTLTPGSGIHTIKVGADDTGTELLAREYAKYKLSFLADAMEKESSELLVRLGVLQNYLV